MAEGYIDISPIIRAVNNVNNNIGIVNNNVNRIDSNLNIVNNNLENVRRQTMNELALLKKQVKDMQNEQRFAAALQRALTEIIRVRQELESKFGTHKLVRTNMLGILQATDLGLITESTISRCTEELMISAPKYWLAPCLIALAAWISNNESLAKRAVAEAVKRDREKTCLLFALITRRVNAGRIQAGKPATNTTFEWLAEYFKLQNPMKMRKSVIAYIDAYTNGIFGEDKDNLCNDHINHWMDVLRKDKPTFVEEQKDWWLNVFKGYCSGNAMNSYAELARVCEQSQYLDIKNYLQTIDAAQRDTGIKHFVQDIIDAPINYDQLINDIDDQLTRLVSNYEEEEESLRDEEQLLEYIKQFKGDERRANNLMDALKARRIDVPVDFAQRLASSIVTPDSTSSEKKTALMMLRPYINEAFKQFITENKDAYPKEIDLKIAEEGKVVAGEKFTWTGKTENAENKEELVKDLSAKYEAAKNKALAKITDDEANKKIKTGKFLYIIIVGFFMVKKGKAMLKENEEKRAKIKKYYDNAKLQNIALLDKALDQRVAASKVVEDFLADEANESISF